MEISRDGGEEAFISKHADTACSIALYTTYRVIHMKTANKVFS
jgi:hypothetical protein